MIEKLKKALDKIKVCRSPSWSIESNWLSKTCSPYSQIPCLRLVTNIWESYKNGMLKKSYLGPDYLLSFSYMLDSLFFLDSFMHMWKNFSCVIANYLRTLYLNWQSFLSLFSSFRQNRINFSNKKIKGKTIKIKAWLFYYINQVWLWYFSKERLWRMYLKRLNFY